MDTAPKKRIPGTTGTDISEDRKGDPSRVTPAQPDLYIDEEADPRDSKGAQAPEEPRESLDDAVEEEPWVEDKDA